MDGDAGSKTRAETVLRWTGRLLGSVLAAAWLFFGAISALFAREPFTIESLAIATFGFITIAGAVFAWRRERLGGSVLFLGGLALGAFAYWSAGRTLLWRPHGVDGRALPGRGAACHRKDAEAS